MPKNSIITESSEDMNTSIVVADGCWDKKDHGTYSIRWNTVAENRRLTVDWWVGQSVLLLVLVSEWLISHVEINWLS